MSILANIRRFLGGNGSGPELGPPLRSLPKGDGRGWVTFDFTWVAIPPENVHRVSWEYPTAITAEEYMDQVERHPHGDEMLPQVLAQAREVQKRHPSWALFVVPG